MTQMTGRPSARFSTFTVASAVLLALAPWALVGCGEPQGEDPAAHLEVTTADAAVRLVGEADADLLLYVSNQSFDDSEVLLTVTIDGVTVVEGDLHVEGQHNWVSFPLHLSTTSHEITAASDSGATLRESFEVPRGNTRYAVIEHWTEAGSADLTWQFQRRPLAFA